MTSSNPGQLSAAFHPAAITASLALHRPASVLILNQFCPINRINWRDLKSLLGGITLSYSLVGIWGIAISLETQTLMS